MSPFALLTAREIEKQAPEMEEAVLRLLDCVPLSVCASAAERQVHVRAPAFRALPRVARGCVGLLEGAALLAAAPGGSDATPALDAALARLCDGLELRGVALCGGGDTVAQQLLRSLFLCATLLLHAALAAAPPALGARHAEAALRALAALAPGAVSVPQLDGLERTLLTRLEEAGRAPALAELALAAPPMRATPSAADARRRLVLRWVGAALSRPSSAVQLQPAVPQLLAAASTLRSPVEPSAALLRGALGSLAAEVGEERAQAEALLMLHLRHCSALLEAEAAAVAAVTGGDGGAAGADGTGAGGGAGVNGATLARLTRRGAAPRPAAPSMCALLFALIPAVKEPLVAPLLAAAEELALRAPTPWQRARCRSQLRDAVCASFNYYRKERLVHWLLQLPGEGDEVALPS